MSGKQVVRLTVKEYTDIERLAQDEGISVKEYLAREYRREIQDIEVKVIYKLAIPEELYKCLSEIAECNNPTLTVKELLTGGIVKFFED